MIRRKMVVTNEHVVWAMVQTPDRGTVLHSLVQVLGILLCRYNTAHIPDFLSHRHCSRSRRRAANGSKRMYLDYTHGLFIT
jgi:hypothetical protein